MGGQPQFTRPQAARAWAFACSRPLAEQKWQGTRKLRRAKSYICRVRIGTRYDHQCPQARIATSPVSPSARTASLAPSIASPSHPGQFRAGIDQAACRGEATPFEGLGATLDQFRAVCRHDPEALDLIDRATQSSPGRPMEKLDNVHSFPSGNASAAALRRLRKDRPDLHKRALAGELSPHAAAGEARTPMGLTLRAGRPTMRGHRP